MALHTTFRHKATLYATCLVIAASSSVAVAAPGNESSHGSHGQPNAHQEHSQRSQHGPQVDSKRVFNQLEKHRGQFGDIGSGQAQRGYAKGEKLPRGIDAQPLDRRVTADLPRYQGYEWRRIGTDVILVSIASGVIYEVLQNALH